MRDIYLVQGVRKTEIAVLCGVSDSVIDRALRKFGLTKEKKSKLLYQDPDWLYQEYVVKRRTAKEISDQFGKNPSAAWKFVKKFGFDKPQLGPAKCKCAYCGIDFDLDRAQYNGQKKRGQVDFYCSSACLNAYDSKRMKKLRAAYKRYFSTEEGKQKRLEMALKSNLKQAEGRETTIEQKIRERLEQLNISHIAQHPIGYYVVDFLLPEINLCVEVNGVYWHGHPDFYPEPNEMQRKTISKDKRKKTFLERRGYRVIYLWEHNINADLDSAFQPVLEAIQATHTTSTIQAIQTIPIDLTPPTDSTDSIAM